MTPGAGTRASWAGHQAAQRLPPSTGWAIVVDECHDDSYYQSEGLPHYHARETAVQYAELSGAVCLLGSATPDVVNVYRGRKGAWQYLRLPARILAHREAVQAQIARLENQGARPRRAADHYRPLEAQAEATDLPRWRSSTCEELKSGNRSIFSRLYNRRSH
jgi:primosomal protein N' (replication factor Y)